MIPRENGLQLFIFPASGRTGGNVGKFIGRGLNVYRRLI